MDYVIDKNGEDFSSMQPPSGGVVPYTNPEGEGEPEDVKPSIYQGPEGENNYELFIYLRCEMFSNA